MPTNQLAPPIARGFQYRLRLQVTGDQPAFPAGCQLKAEVRAYPGAAELAGTLSTTDGTLVRIDDNTVEVRMPASLTATIGSDRAALDVVRTDLSPDEWLGIQVSLPVTKPVTVPGADA